MINSTSSSDRVLRPDGVVLHSKTPSAGSPEADRFAPEHTAALRAALASQPEIRADVVARAKLLAADPAYPSPAILRHVGQAILNSPDPAYPSPAILRHVGQAILNSPDPAEQAE